LELFNDPITIPCGHSFSRLALATQFESSGQRKFPVCQKVFDDFDPMTASKNITLANLVDEISEGNKMEEPTVQKWSCTVTPVKGGDGKYLPWAELKLLLENSTFVTRPTLLIMIVDISGSMWGDPMRQVREALKHTMAMIHSNPFIKPILITYQSVAKLVDVTGPLELVNATIEANVQAGGGNNEEAAFRLMGDVLKNYKYNDDDDAQNDENNVSNVTVAFLTDEQACRNRQELIDILHDVLDENWTEPWDGPLTIHTIGFSQSCDRKFLEDIRQVGSIEGIFRYAEPQDNDNTLCQKLQALFEAVSSSSRIPITIKLDQLELKVGKQFVKELGVQFPISRSQKGNYTHWIKYNHDEDLEQNLGSIEVTPSIGNKATVPIKLRKPTKRIEAKLLESWISKLVDDLASEVIELGKVEVKDRNDVFELHCVLVLQRVEAIIASAQNEGLVERLEFISQQVEALRSGSNVHMGKLGDLRFGSQFAVVKSQPKPSVSPSYKPHVPSQPLQIASEPRWKEEFSKVNDTVENYKKSFQVVIYPN